MMFVISVVYLKPNEDPLDRYLQKDLSTSIISAMLKTDSGCTKDTTIEDLLIDKAKSGDNSAITITCDPEIADQMKAKYENVNGNCTTIINGNDALKCSITQILKPLAKMGRPYQFRLKIGEDTLDPDNLDIRFKEEQFAFARSMDVTPYTLPIYPTNLVLEIWLCIGGECPNV